MIKCMDSGSEEERKAYKAAMDLAPRTRSESAFYGPRGVKPATLLKELYTAIGARGVNGSGSGLEQGLTEDEKQLEAGTPLPLPKLEVVYLHGTRHYLRITRRNLTKDEAL